jgi:hypothetical protein
MVANIPQKLHITAIAQLKNLMSPSRRLWLGSQFDKLPEQPSITQMHHYQFSGPMLLSPNLNVYDQ